MNHFVYFDKKQLESLVSIREGETKFGEKISIKNQDTSLEEFLNQTPALFIIYGIKESIGVAANFGRTGTESAFEIAIKNLCNIQHNKLCKGSWVSILGAFDFHDLQQDTTNHSIESLREKVNFIDKQVTFLNSQIIKAGKIPIIIGGGHNNAYANIKGLSLSKNQSVNTINFDAHTDFRALEGRHSGNGFSYAFEEGFLDRYFIFGLHENYTSKNIFKNLKKYPQRLQYVSYEEMEVRCEKKFSNELLLSKQFIKNKPFGIEIDLDAIEGVASSAITPAGYHSKHARQFIHTLAGSENASYLHICEGAPLLDSNQPSTVGKLISYLISDFIKARIQYKNA